MNVAARTRCPPPAFVPFLPLPLLVPLLLALAALLTQPLRAAPAPASAPAAAVATPTPASLPRSPRLPQPPGPPGYVSAATCAECHQEEHASWHRSFHRSMTQAMDTNSVVADFNGTTLETHGERFTLGWQGNAFWADVEDLSAPAGTPSARLPMELMTGSHHMQVFWVPAGAGNAQIGFPFTWLIPERRWVPRESTFIRDPHAPRQIETWNMTCIRCHVTAGRPRPRREQGIFDTRAADLGIACEACHGPAAEHVAFRRAHPDLRPPRPTDATKPIDATSPPPPAPAPPPADPIIQPARLTATRGSQVCAQCHGMKWFDSSEGWVENGFRFRPGDDLEATTPILRPGHTQNQPALRAVLERSPQLLDEFFWSDGMIRVAGREFNGLVESACHQKGGLSCLTCHSLHGYTDPADQLKPGMEGNRACLPCHDSAKYGTVHTRHREGSSGSLCYNCHLPHTTYALLGGIRQHQIDSPRIDVTLRTGRPNACNLCHLDRSLAWVRDQLASGYLQPKTPVPDETGATSAIVELLLSGDAGQRALATWHLAWEPARTISGSDWQAPLLIRTLEDPYAAVRLIAHRSLRSLPGFTNLPPAPLVTPADQKRAAAEARGRWGKAEVTARDPVRARALLLRTDGLSDVPAIDRWLGRRNDRPMRLRE